MTHVLYGAEGLAPWLAKSGDHGETTLLVDAAVAQSPITEHVRRQIGRARRHETLIELRGPGDADSVRELAARLTGTGLVLAVGGGSLLDQAKLASLLCGDQDAQRRLMVRQRSGLLLLPPLTKRAVPLFAVPTTLGTGAEVSTVACLAYPEGKRLITGACLRPDLAVLDPVATATLPAELVSEGVLETLFRLTSGYLGDHEDRATEDALVETLAARVAQEGYAVARAHAAGGRVDDALLLEIAKLSGLAHNEFMHFGRPSFVNKGWLIANELSTGLGARKMAAVALVMPELWRRVAKGDGRLGSARRLGRLWTRIRAAAPAGLPADPGQGIAALIDAWGVDRSLRADRAALDVIAGRIVRSWGTGLPMLGALTRDDIDDFLTRAVSATAPDDFPRHTGVGDHHMRKEVC
ncbi:daptide-type RiPP biosynthesis dehydogenase [Nonomuraea sp. NPDC049400]|uniref:daptide-type RiPP biosynthesis dehydogenase n=1 Tax=Nonomuraea sp. NPDC049400 TaxID=3364352 RepID=UPI003787F5FE